MHCLETVTILSTFNFLSVHQYVTEMAAESTPPHPSSPRLLCAFFPPAPASPWQETQHLYKSSYTSTHTDVNVNNEGFTEGRTLRGHSRILESH